jgi:hypothetical protein
MMELKVPNIETEYKTVFEEDGSVKFIRKSEIKKGKKRKSSGGQFELRVRKDLEKRGWIVDKWSNNLDGNKIVPAKRVFRRFNTNMGVMTIGTGFPDFIAFRRLEDGSYKIIGVEVKVGGSLSRIEKKKCEWYLNNNIFSDILVASKKKVKNRVRVEYVEVNEILERMR